MVERKELLNVAREDVARKLNKGHATRIGERYSKPRHTYKVIITMAPFTIVMFLEWLVVLNATTTSYHLHELFGFMSFSHCSYQNNTSCVDTYIINKVEQERKNKIFSVSWRVAGASTR